MRIEAGINIISVPTIDDLRLFREGERPDGEGGRGTTLVRTF